MCVFDDTTDLPQHLTPAAFLCFFKVLFLISRAEHALLCDRACASECVHTSYILFSRWFLFSGIHNLSAVERLDTVSGEKSLGTLAIQGLWKCTHSLAQLVPKGVPA